MAVRRCCAALGIDTQRPCARLDGAASCSSPMKPRISLLTLGVDDLERSLAFYRDGLGLPTEGIIGTEFERGAVAFFELSGGLKLALWERSNIAFDAQLPQSAPSPTDFTIAHNVPPVPGLSKPPPRPSMAATPATSRTPTVTSGKSPGTRRSSCQADQVRLVGDDVGNRSVWLRRSMV